MNVTANGTSASLVTVKVIFIFNVLFLFLLLLILYIYVLFLFIVIYFRHALVIPPPTWPQRTMDTCSIVPLCSPTSLATELRSSPPVSLLFRLILVCLFSIPLFILFLFLNISLSSSLHSSPLSPLPSPLSLYLPSSMAPQQHLRDRCVEGRWLHRCKGNLQSVPRLLQLRQHDVYWRHSSQLWWLRFL